MATTTFRVAAGDSNNVATYAAAAFTPPVGDLIIVAALTTGTLDSGGSGHTCSDNRTGGSYTRIEDAQKGSGADQLAFYVRNALVTFSGTHTITVDTGGDNGTGAVVGVWTINGVTRSGSSAIRQATTPRSSQTAGTSPVLTFATNTLTSNVLLACLVNATNPATITAPGSWTEDWDVGYATPTSGSWGGHRDSGATTTSFTIGSSGSQWGAIGVEIDTSALTVGPSATTVAGTTTIGAHTPSAEVVVPATTVSRTVAIGSPTITAIDASFVYNLIPNPSNEIGSFNWDLTGGTDSTGGLITASGSDGAYSSDNYYSVTATDNAASAVVATASSLSESAEVDGSTGYQATISVRAYNSEALNVEVQASVDFYNGGVYAGSIAAGGSDTLSSNLWTEIGVSGTSPSGAEQAIIVVTTTNNFNAGAILDLDAAILTRNDIAVVYFDGDTTDGGGYSYAWSGTPGESASVRTITSGGAAISATTVAGVASFGTPTRVATAAHAATTVSRTVAISGTATAGSGAAVSATTVSRTVAFGSLSISVGTQAAITATNVAGTVAVGVHTPRAGAAHSATTVSRTVAISGTPSVGTSAAVTAVNVAGTVAVGVHTPRAGAAHAATTVSRTVAISGTAAAGSAAAVSATTVSRTVTVSGTASAAGSAGVAATTVNGVATVAGYAPVAHAAHTAATVAGSVAVATPSVTIGGASAPASVTGAATVSGTASASVAFSVSTVTVTSAVGAPVISAPQNYNATPATVAATITISGAARVAVQPATISRTVTISGTARIGYAVSVATIVSMAVVSSGGALAPPAARDMVVTGTLLRNYSGYLRPPAYSGALRSKEDAS